MTEANINCAGHAAKLLKQFLAPQQEADDRLARIDSTLQILDACDPSQDAERIQDCLHATLVVLRELAAKEPR